ncbi:non-ribosomal peptide synthase/polyketide synthase [Pseudomonas sichuanensis]|uniref:non-ribosomal peptide synthase/polyketide synthase n=1 Tax=Pseudomonas sichuanensis TaxID=2213015 RepID=UPI00244A5E35|nr:non-ribosomal peptide synthase/polyketide synthase [Pseudomonas sichuanensis]MDH0732573.1 non-ribosomal peptide synthase/polyketide synthase [Pseudomonas sichuanensis]MDH1582744.1 non-ribosomal peptide synthase/polyketide synthase [Pseudomonas sichuanensis]MDH1598088.1 non-ribosomal peptide synthase/polyketide synthase [Pseudomonas sichuanensis]
MQELIGAVGALSAKERKALARMLKEKGIDLFAVAPVFKRDPQAPLRLSYAQQRQWFLWQLDPHSAAYNIPTALRLQGELDHGALQAAFATLLARHGALRTGFVEDQDQVLQFIREPQPFALPLQTLQPGEAPEARIEQLLGQCLNQPFDLRREPLLRAALLRTGEREHVLALAMHHIVSDGWSMQLIVRELMQCYAAFSRGQQPVLAPLAIDYADYALWQREWMEAGERERQLAYWVEQLGREALVLELPADRPRPLRQSFRGARLDIQIDAALADGLKQLAQRSNVTLFMLLLASFQTLLHRYSGQADIRVGVPVANRTRVEVEGLVGFFANTQVLAARFDACDGFADLLGQVKARVLGAQSHQDLPFEQLVEALAPERTLSHNPLFQAMFNHQGSSAAQAPAGGNLGLTAEVIEREGCTAQVDLTLATEEHAQGLAASLTYATDLFDAASAERMARHWVNLLRAVVAAPQGKLGELAMLGADERERIVGQWNATADSSFPLDQPVQRLIEAQVALTPDAPALQLGDQVLSYAQLNARANQLARHLVHLGVGPDCLVGIALERSVEMVVGLLAVLKAGGAYVPLDPEYPTERLAYMIEDSGVQLLLTSAALLERLPVPAGVNCLSLDTLALGHLAEDDLGVVVQGENLAYMIYTSGSTGRPKGAANRHRALTNRLCWMQQAYGLDASDAVLQKTPFSFDVSVWEFFWPLMTGARLVLARPGEHRDPARLVRLINEHGITTLHFVPSMLQAFMLDPQAGSCQGLKRIICSGEALALDTQQQVLAQLGQAGLYNLYGPTEAAIDVTHWTCREQHQHSVPIGEPIANLSTHILDAGLNPVAAGVVGELYLGGEGLARGYHQRPGLTAERFVASPFGAGQRLYRTGDLARYRADGVIEYAGRIDHQVKIRGLRIELGEIEARLQEQAQVSECVAIAGQGAAGVQLLAYVVPSDPALAGAEAAVQRALVDQLKAALGQSMPDYMVPAHMILLPSMPLSPNGKLDRKALPAFDQRQVQALYRAPETERERSVAAIWQQLLGCEQVGLDDDFFTLGGHSLLATQLVSRVRQALAIDVPLRVLFEHSQLQAFVAALAQGERREVEAIPALPRDAGLALSYAQERQWFLWQLEPHSTAYVIPMVLQLQGELDVAALGQAFQALFERHESLRTCFQEQDGQCVQVFHDGVQFPLPVQCLPAGAEEQAAIAAFVGEQVGRPFDLRGDLLMRAALLQLAPQRHVLVVTQHHIVSDGWSMQVMIDELLHCYGAARAGQPVQLPALAIQYADYAAWQRQWMDAGERERQLDYWKTHLGTAPVVLELPTDHVRPVQQSLRGARLEVPVDAALHQRLKALAEQQGSTLFMLLLAAYQTLLFRSSGQPRIRVGVPIANRNRLETERLIGFFVNTQVLQADLRGEDSFLDLLAQVRQATLAAQDHQDLPFEQLVDALQPERSLSYSPLFQVMFNHQAEHAGAAQAPRALAGLEVRSLGWSGDDAQFDLTLSTHESPGQLAASFTYATDLFEAASVQRLAGHWLGLLAQIVERPEAALGELRLLDAAEQARLASFNPAREAYASELCIHQLIDRQAAAAPHALALIDGERRLDHAWLQARANRLAHHLVALGVGPEVRVGVAMPRNAELLVALLAVLKAGGTYVPLDPDYPRDRLAYMLEDSQARVLLTQAGALDGVPLEGLATVLVAEEDAALAAYPHTAPVVAVRPDNLAYVIYTSGSTGKPKGVAIAHRNVAALVHWSAGVYPREAIRGVLASTSVCFDLSVWELFVTLANGGQLILARNALELGSLPARDEVRLVNTVPSAIAALLRAGDIPAGVKIVNLAGEPLKQELVDGLYALGTLDHVYDLYGPSEDTTYSTYCRREAGGQASIGRPLCNSQGYLLDDQLHPVPVGVAAELYLAGDGVTRGYLLRPGLTAEKFVPNPSGEAGERMYRTGDLTRYREDGQLEYIGRVDHQVKVRGFRIELGEIETRLQQQAGVREAVVLAVEGASGHQLVGYLVANAALDSEQVKAALREQLPEYMVPAHLLQLPALPLTPNGKLDRKALPLPDLEQAQADYQAPATDLEQRIAAIWQDVLKLERIGARDNFFELGGDSIISLQVVSRARQAGIHFTPKQLFQHQTVQGLAAVASLDGNGLQVAQGRVEGPTALLPIHRVFFDEVQVERHHWNQSVLLKPQQPLDAARLEQALASVLEHHDALRLGFVEAQGQWQATYHGVPAHSVLWRREVADAAALEALGREAQASLDLASGPLLRAVLAEYQGEQRLLLVIHHLAVDGVSWRILFEDLQQAYEQGTQAQLPARTSSVRDWAGQLQDYARGDAASQRDYWQAQLQGADTDLPCERPEGSLANQHGRSVATQLSRETTRKLLQEAPAAYRTQVNDLLLCALARVIGRWSGRDDTLIQLEGHGREALFDALDLTRTVGWFTSLFPVRLGRCEALGSNLRLVKEQLRAIPDKGLGWGALRYLGDERVQAELAALPVPRITFNYLGQFDGSFAAEDGALFVPAGEAVGPDQSPLAALGNWLTLNGQVYGGEFSMGWRFSTQMFDEATVQRLADDYGRELEALVEHCCTLQERSATPSDFPLAGLDMAGLDSLPVPLAQIEDIYPLSPMQQGMLFHTVYEHSGDYINQMRLEVEGLEPARFAAAWQACVDDHDVLRSSFLWQGLERPLQVIRKSVQLNLRELDWRDRAADTAALDQLAADERAQGFDPAEPPLLRLLLVRLGEQRHHLIYTSHHILMDGWSNSRLMGEVLQRYRGQAVPAQAGRYRNYIAWLGAQDPAATEQFWRGQVAGLEVPTRLARVFGDLPQGEGGQVELYTGLDAQQTQALSDFARQHKLTMNTLVQGAWALLLSRYTGQQHVAFGATVAGRPAELVGIEQQLGLFINTLPVVVDVESQQPLGEWLAQLQLRNLALREHEHTALFDVQRWAQLGDNLFDTLLVFENFPISEALQQAAPDSLRFGEVHNHEQTNFPLTLMVVHAEELVLHLSFDSRSFPEQGMRRLGEQLSGLLARLPAQFHLPLAELPSLEAAEQARLAGFNPAREAYESEQCIHRLIERQAAQTPEALALIDGERRLDHAWLQARANRLAHHLVALGVGPEVRVGVAMPRNAELLVALLAVLKAGGTYVPLDPDYPLDRLAYMLEDSQARVLLTQPGVLEGISLDGLTTVLVAEDDAALAQYPSSAPVTRVTAQNLAYVIYTSGSTGRPKGVAITHRNIVALAHWSAGMYSHDEIQGVLASTSVCFDLSVWELFVTLANGGYLILARNALELGNLPARAEVRLINTVPSAIAALLRAGDVPAEVDIVNLCGEPLKQGLVDSLYALGTLDHVYDLYGPSEDTVYSTFSRRLHGGMPSIGQPMCNSSALLLDDQLQAAPVGVAAELYLAGDGLARGYLLRPGLTAEKFVPNPSGEAGERMYRTGDLTRYREDGQLEYIGRVDHQVKVRGFRIELGEIETRLQQQAGVREAVVLAVEGASGHQLVGYLVANAALDSEQVKAALREQLPEYMVPAHLLQLPALPLTPNGKLDRKALPLPDLEQAQADYQAPATDLEQRIAAIWQDVLKLERIGARDNFFELGGDSIISLQVVSRARQAGIHFTPKQLFQHQTVQGLAAVASLDGNGLQVAQGRVEGPTALLPIHRVFFDEVQVERHHWNQSVLLKPQQPLDAARLEQALASVLEHHDALRLGFVEAQGQWQATYHGVPAHSVLWRREVADAAALEALGREAQASLDLASGPLLRAVLAEYQGEQRLLLVIHHLAVDGVSWRILFEDLQQAYEQGTQAQLPARTSSVRDWAGQLQDYARGDAASQRDYWQAQLQGADTDLPCERPEGSLANQHGRSVATQLSRETTRKLLQEAPAAYRTQVNDLLLCALARVIGRWSGRDDTLIQLEGHGREALFDALDLTRTVGWFTSLFPVRLGRCEALGSNLRLVKEQLRAIPDKGLGWGALRYLGDERVQAELAALPVPRITFNYLGQFDGSFAAEDGALFVPAGEAVGPDQSPLAALGNWLTLNGQVYGGEFSMGWRFSTQMFDEATVQRLADDYGRELEALVEHCCTLQERSATPSDFPLAGLDMAGLDSLPVPLAQIEDIYPLSPMQQGMLFHTQDGNGADLYINQISVPVQGLDLPRFEAAWNQVIARHEILRTGFCAAATLAQPLQLVRREARLPLQVIDWRDREVSPEALQAVAAADCAKGFDLLQAPLTRITLVRTAEDAYQLIWTSHHILMDGWSTSRLLGEVFQAYAGQALPEREGRYRDYIDWLHRQSAEADEQFWRARLADLDGPTLLAGTLAPQPAPGESGHGALYLNWDAAATARLKAQAQRLRVTSNTLIQATWLLLLQRYSGQSSVCFGAVVAGRPASLAGADEMLGLFINTLPIAQTIDPQLPVGEWLTQLQAYNLEARDHEHASLADVQRWSGQGGQALFDSIVVFENYPIDERLADAGDDRLSFGEVKGRDVTNYAMDLAVSLGSTLSIEFLYLRERFTEAACAQVMSSFEVLLSAMLDDAQATLGSLGVLDAQACDGLQRGNVLAAGEPAPLLVHAIARQAALRPDAEAVTCAGQSLTYGQLEQRANALATRLLAAGVGPETRVGVALERSVQMIVAFYAVMKTGAAYVPLDIDYPRERLDWIIEDSAMSVLITESRVSARLGDTAVALSIELDTAPLPSAAQAVVSSARPGNLAYLIYTSGSTGKPKGVAVSQGGIAMHCAAIAERYEMGPHTRELLFMSFAFDGAQERWLSTLLHGGCLVVRDNQLWTAEQTWQVLHEQAITIACFPPAYLQQLAEFAEGRQPPAVDIYCFGGDAVAQANFDLVRRNLRPRCLTNGYGPTETVVTPLLWKVAADARCDAAYAPIGTRVGERTLYVLDTHLNPLPTGVAGELYIGGEGVARGYHARPGLTAERFVADPFSAGGRLYRTGDLVRQRADGVFDYLGRLDNQVKVRGFRIELGEIEARLRQQPGVRDAVVIARREDSGDQLLGYVVTAADGPAEQALREALQAQLPDYMVPSRIMVLDALPLNPNGKVDRKALPLPGASERHYQAPRNLAEQALVEVWQEVLGVERVGVTDNFFELGGDSLRILKVLGKLRGRSDLGLELKLRDLMTRPTIAQLSGYDEQQEAALDPLLLLNSPSPARPALFCLHAGFGTVFDYEPLARQLEGRHSVYGLQCRMLLDRDWQDDSLQGMAIDYAQYIRQKQADGPYLLLGWSLGGTLAVLVAEELRRQGQEVGFVGLVDSFIPGQGASLVSDDEELRSFLAVTLQCDAEQLPAVVCPQPLQVAQLAETIGQVQAQLASATGFDAQDLAQGFVVAMRLKALSERQGDLPTLDMPIHCWWAGDAASQAAVAVFEAGLGQVAQRHWLNTTHFAIPRHAALLKAVHEYLGSLETLVG